jgi:hypothetical protein
VVGTLLLTAASMLLAIALEDRDLSTWSPDGGTRVDVARLERAA